VAEEVMLMRILMLTQWFQPEPSFKGLPFAVALRDRGHDVEVLTGFPNYPEGVIYPGYRIRPWQREEMKGIRVTRVPVYPSHDRHGIGRILNYLSFGASAGILGPWLVKKPDIVYVYNLVTLGPAARLLRWINGCKIVLDVQDLWPESVASSGMMRNRWLLRILSRWCRAEYNCPDRVVVLSPGFKKNLVARGVPEERVEVVWDWCDESTFPLPAQEQAGPPTPGSTSRFNIVYAGTMGLMQGLDTVVEAARKLAYREPRVLFTLVGSGVEVDRLRQNALDLANVQFLPRKPMAEIGAILAQADALLVHLKEDPLFEITIPSKVPTYLHAGRPMLCGVKGDAAELVLRAQAGITFHPENADSLVEAVLNMLSLSRETRRTMGDNGKRFYREHLSLETGVSRLEALFESLLSPRRVFDQCPGCA
jgi:colanic acid biosynthesis glycosyl transferase WcaI